MDPYLGEIKAVGFNYAPQGWALCQGQTLPINQNTALFSLLGTTYGGDGRTTFGLPDLRGRTAVGFGQGPGLANYSQGQSGGSESVTLSVSQMPAHNHTAEASANQATAASPAGNYLPTSQPRTTTPYATGPAGTAMGQGMISNTGGSQSHPNLQPFLVINYIIALQGIFPPRP